jgi:hypothetical protein
VLDGRIVVVPLDQLGQLEHGAIHT